MIEIKEVITLDRAAEDLDNGKEFYDAREYGVGLYFIDSLLSDIESLHIRAGIHSMHHGFYRMLSKRFPFALYYDIEDEIARVAAVLDMRQNPVTIRSKLRERK